MAPRMPGDLQTEPRKTQTTPKREQNVRFVPMISCRVVFLLLFPAGPVVAAGDDLPAEFRVEPLQAEPVFTGQPGAWDTKIRERGWVRRDGDQWWLWYTGYDPEAQPPLMRLGLATSSDGLNWKRHSDQPLMDDLWVEDMMVVKHDGTYFMFAEGLNDHAQLLTSTDRVNWTHRGTLTFASSTASR